MDAETPSILSCIAKKLPIVAISRDFLAFEDDFDAGNGPTRCCVTLLPLSAGGAWVDYVYALVTLDSKPAEAKPAKARKAEAPEPVAEDPVEELVEDPAPEAKEEAVEEVAEPVAETPEQETVDDLADLEPVEPEDEAMEAPVEAVDEVAPVDQPAPKATPGFSKLLDSLAGLTGFYGSQPVKVEPVVYEPERFEEPVDHVAPMPIIDDMVEPVADDQVEEPVVDDEEQPPTVVAEAEEPVVVEETAPRAETKSTRENPTRAPEGTLQNKLTDVRAKADEARMAKLRANVALYEGLSAAYDFALDAEEAPEEYLRLVEAQGLKIQLRSPMKPVVKLAFDGMCDDMTIKQLEAVLAWAFDEELPRGTLAERIEEAGGIGPILSGEAKAA